MELRARSLLARSRLDVQPKDDLMSQKCGLFFDFDGVLVETSALKVDAFMRACCTQAPDLCAALHPALAGELVGKSRTFIASWLACRQDGFSTDQFLNDFAEDLALAFGDLQLRPAVASFFEKTRALGIKTAIVSAAPKTDIVSILEANQFASDRLDGIFGSEAGSKSAVMQLLLTTWGMNPARAVMVGDMPSDGLAAGELGVDFVRFLSSYGDHCHWDQLPAHLTVESFEQLSAMIDQQSSTASDLP